MAIINELLIEQLLNESESSTLDFKEKQYRFIGATDEEKSELLKDILSFGNAFRRTDAFILIGVEEVKGGRSIPTGISEDIDDASLQQFVNSKTNKPIMFSYSVKPFENVKLGIINIPIQQRPIYLLRDYGKLKKESVYIRRGTSTGIATPDEIAQMSRSITERTISDITANVLEYMVKDMNEHMDSRPKYDDIIKSLNINHSECKNAFQELESLGIIILDSDANSPIGYARAKLNPSSFIQFIDQIIGDVNIIEEINRILDTFPNNGDYISSEEVLKSVGVPIIRLQQIIHYLHDNQLIEAREVWIGENKLNFSHGRLLPLGKRILKRDDPLPVLNIWLK